ISTITNGGNNPSLSNVAQVATFDNALLSFDFTANGNTLTFQYVFGSDEFAIAPFQAGTGFNDAFAAFLAGQNIAFLPGTNPAITVANLSRPGSSQFLIPNPVGNYTRNTEFNALTTVLTVTVPVNPGRLYHMAFAIADGTNGLFDSGAMICANSFDS